MKLASKFDSPDQAHDEAASWYARRQSGTLTADELLEFDAWRSANARNASAWSAVDATHHRIARLVDLPEFTAMRQEALQASARATRSKRWSIAASLVMLLAGTGGLFVLLDRADQGGKSAVSASLAYRTAVGEIRTVTLADGSSLTLNTDSEVLLPAWTEQRRIVLVRGEGFFRVAKDATRPFIVETGKGNVRAVGTAFSVRKVDSGFRVALAEGEVKVAIPTLQGEESLKRGQALAFDGVKVSRGDAGAATWISGELVFDNVTLVDAITEVNRYSMQKIVLVGGAAAGRRQLSGVFKTGDVSTFARAVEAYGMARIERQNASEIRLSGI